MRKGQKVNITVPKDNATEVKKPFEEEVYGYVNSSFSLDEDAVFVVDLGPKIKKERTVLDNTFKRSILNEITVFIEQEENLNLSIEHLDFDRFRVRVKKNKDIFLIYPIKLMNSVRIV